jgi:hypothetical protein
MVGFLEEVDMENIMNPKVTGLMRSTMQNDPNFL